MRAPKSQVIRGSVLVADDERNIRTTLGFCLEEAGFRPVMASSRRIALRELDGARFELAFLDLCLGDDNGLELIPELLARQPGLPIGLISALGDPAIAMEAIEKGAWDFLPKPFTPEQVRQVVQGITGGSTRHSNRPFWPRSHGSSAP